ncbi:related to phosphorus acquisition-controlling protein [Phialocephala subalpina]|uniref:Related to phosphorus acquisition-controlling protein n=1 Tax=Phialocephala subalpina TaxID=576137 RepID=A0A1L7WDJ9_9HELO|nr:related to phosphorus acquisition-controlling protein [Phialocephala subalpina]
MMDSSGVWNGQDPTLSVSSQDDFQQFLDMGGMSNLGEGLPFEFQDFSAPQGQRQMMNQDEGESMDAAMENGRGMMGQDTTMQDQMPAMTTSTSHPGILGSPLNNGHGSNESLSDLDAQINFLQQQRHNQQQRQIQEQQRNFYAQQRMGVPPTPQSIEMHSNPNQFYQQHSDPQQQAMYERFRMQVKEQQEMAFTPLVSPAVTPLEAHFTIPEYTVPGAYFSPLSSPALHAQNEHQSVYDQRHSGATNSPIDANLESHSAPGSSNILARKSSKKTLQKPRSTRAVRQSPIVKPRKGKKGPSSAINSHVLGDIIEPSHSHPQSKDPSSSHSVSTEESENGSISPEHLSDMAPPPLPPPGSARGSPYIQAQTQGQRGNPRTQQLVLGSPATPASLMRLASSPQDGQPVNQNMDLDDPGMDGFALPEAAGASRPQLSRLETQSDGQITPTLSSTTAKTPGFQPLPSPAFSRSATVASASQSPQIDAMNGSNGVNGNTRKTPQMSGRSSKKRSSSSVLASPALLPRISPSIKPLLPGGGKVSEDTASLLLASKSNYQNILEGTHLPGVSYPTELSTNLTSKRTSHKIAEQGRRNRINSALQEIATLLPKGQAKDSGGEKSGSGDGGGDEPANGKGTAQSANSKASTVEQAIEYIKQLKKDQEQLRNALTKERAEKEELKTEVTQLKQKV